MGYRILRGVFVAMADKKPKPRRLVNVKVDEVSLVDKGAVQDADFVVLSKRIEPVSETKQSEIVEFTKALTDRQQFELQAGLRVLGDVSNMLKALTEMRETLPDEAKSALDEVAKVLMPQPTEKVSDEDEDEEMKRLVEKLQPVIRNMIAEAVQKARDEDDKKKQEDEEENEDAEEDEGVEKSMFDEAGELLLKRRQDRESEIAKQTEGRAFEALSQITNRIDKYLTGLETLDQRLNHATGKE